MNRLNGYEKTMSAKRVLAAQRRIAAQARLVVRPGKLLIVVTPQNQELYRGYDYPEATRILTTHNHTLDERQTSV